MAVQRVARSSAIVSANSAISDPQNSRPVVIMQPGRMIGVGRGPDRVAQQGIDPLADGAVLLEHSDRNSGRTLLIELEGLAIERSLAADAPYRLGGAMPIAFVRSEIDTPS